MADKKKFGLVMPKKAGTFKLSKNSVFNTESDEDENDNKRPKIPQKKLVSKSKIKTESVEDPSIYEYDSIYDEMKVKQVESIVPQQKKNSRYIETLLKAADKRKRVYERRIDKKIQAEREKEGDKFKDKEAFVTSSYKKKMLEKEEEEEKERRENMLNEMMDVTKQKDLSGFYRHFLNQTVGEEKIPSFGEKQIKQEIDSDENVSSQKPDKKRRQERNSDESNSSYKHTECIKDKNIDQDSDGIEIDDSHDDSENQSDYEKSDVENEKEYKKRSMESNDEVCKRVKKTSMSDKLKTFRSSKRDKTHIRKSCGNSSSDSKSSDNEESIENTPLSSVHEHLDNGNEVDNHNTRHDSSSGDETDNELNKKKSDSGDTESDVNKKQSKINIYIKRTVGDVFAEAQARYFQRMSSRN